MFQSVTHVVFDKTLTDLNVPSRAEPEAAIAETAFRMTQARVVERSPLFDTTPQKPRMDATTFPFHFQHSKLIPTPITYWSFATIDEIS